MRNLAKLFIPRLALEFIATCKFALERDINRVWVIIKAVFWVLKNFRTILNERRKVQNHVRTVPDDHVMKLMIKKSIGILFFVKKIKTFHDLKRYF